MKDETRKRGRKVNKDVQASNRRFASLAHVMCTNNRQTAKGQASSAELIEEKRKISV
jgi:hypothetical protein